MIATDTIPAVAYPRRSTEELEQSLGNQRSEIERFASERGYDIVGEDVNDAISGTSAATRSGVRRMIDDAKLHR